MPPRKLLYLIVLALLLPPGNSPITGPYATPIQANANPALTPDSDNPEGFADSSPAGVRREFSADRSFVGNDWHTWHIETVDTSSSAFVSLDLDKSGRPHVSYQAGGIKYAWQDETGWHVEQVDQGDEENTGEANWLALDNADRPHIV